jgi:hypothetical protein
MVRHWSRAPHSQESSGVVVGADAGCRGCSISWQPTTLRGPDCHRDTHFPDVCRVPRLLAARLAPLSPACRALGTAVGSRGIHWPARRGRLSRSRWRGSDVCLAYAMRDDVVTGDLEELPTPPRGPAVTVRRPDLAAADRCTVRSGPIARPDAPARPQAGARHTRRSRAQGDRAADGGPRCRPTPSLRLKPNYARAASIARSSIIALLDGDLVRRQGRRRIRRWSVLLHDRALTPRPANAASESTPGATARLGLAAAAAVATPEVPAPTPTPDAKQGAAGASDVTTMVRTMRLAAANMSPKSSSPARPACSSRKT